MRKAQGFLRSFATAAAERPKVLTRATISPNVVKAEYAVRGEVVIRANKLQGKLQEARAKGEPSPIPLAQGEYDEIVFCNIGNPQSLKQKPITFFRQVLSLVTSPFLLDEPKIASIFPEDAIARAKEILAGIPGGSGAYSHSQGVPLIRENVAEFIARRDGFPSDPENIFLTDGASPGIQLLMRCILRNEKDAVMVPIPQYPLYSASIALLGGQQVGYYLDESKGWGLSVAELERALKEARGKGSEVRALVIINPGNPTGQCLDVENMREIVRFCKRERLVLLADEVYQENSYRSDRPFTSFKKIVKSLGTEYDGFEMASFHSVSKGFLGECGRRGGYMELHGFAPEVVEEFYKMASISLCPNLDGQIMVDLMVKPPVEGQPSYAQYARERDDILQSLKRRALKLHEALNKLEGVSCNVPEGAMYAFPRITLPEKAIAEAQRRGMAPDLMYCVELLENAGICVVPGSGFGQAPSTYHFRTTFLPPESQIASVVDRMSKFHSTFMKKYQ